MKTIVRLFEANFWICSLTNVWFYRKDFKCKFCGQILEEVVSCRHLSGELLLYSYHHPEKVSEEEICCLIWKKMINIFDKKWFFFNFMITDKMIADIIPEYYLKSHHLSRFKQQTITLVVRGLYIDKSKTCYWNSKI